MSAIRVVPQSVYDLCLFKFKEIKVFFINLRFKKDVNNFQEENDGIKRFRDTCKRVARRGS